MRMIRLIKYSLVLAVLVILIICYRNVPYDNEDVIFEKANQLVKSHSNGYTNSQSLREKLKPKLAKPFSPGYICFSLVQKIKMHDGKLILFDK